MTELRRLAAVPTKETGTDVEMTFPAEYWPIRTPSGFVDHEYNIREVSAAMLLAAKGAAAENAQGLLAGDTSKGLEFLAMTLWHMSIQLDEHGHEAGKDGAK
jgi:hypothetical protein